MWSRSAVLRGASMSEQSHDQAMVSLLEAIAFRCGQEMTPRQSVSWVDAVPLARSGLDRWDTAPDERTASRAIWESVDDIVTACEGIGKQDLVDMAVELDRDLDNTERQMFLWSLIFTNAVSRGREPPIEVGGRTPRALVAQLEETESGAGSESHDNWEVAYLERHPDASPETRVRERLALIEFTAAIKLVVDESDRVTLLQWVRDAAEASRYPPEDIWSPWVGSPSGSQTER